MVLHAGTIVLDKLPRGGFATTGGQATRVPGTGALGKDHFQRLRVVNVFEQRTIRYPRDKNTTCKLLGRNGPEPLTLQYLEADSHGPLVRARVPGDLVRAVKISGNAYCLVLPYA